MQKFSRRFLFVALLVLGIAMAISAGGEPEPEQGIRMVGPTTGEHTITMTVAEFAQFPFSEEWAIIQLIREQTSINLEPEIIPTSDYGNKIDIMLAAGTGADIITNIYNDKYSRYADLGFLFPFGDYYDQMPNFEALIATDPVWQQELATQWVRADGGTYMVPALRDFPDAEFGLMIRDDLFMTHYGSLPTTADELLEGLIAIKAGEGDDFLGFGARNQTGAFLVGLANMFGRAPAGWGLGNGVRYDEDADNFYFAVDGEHTRAFLRFTAQLHAEGLIDPENYTQDVKTFESKLTNGRYAAGFTWYPGIGRLTPIGQEQVGPEFSLLMLPLPEGSPDEGWGVRKINATSVAFDSVISDKSDEEFSAYINFIDWMYSEDASIAQSWGIQGESFVVDGGSRQPANTVRTGRNLQGTIEPRSTFGVNVLSLTWRLMGDAESAFVWNPEVEQYIQTSTEQNKFWPPDPAVFFNETEQETIDLYRGDLTTYINETYLKFITGEMSVDSDWDEFIAGCRARNSDEITAAYNAAWARQSGN